MSALTDLADQWLQKKYCKEFENTNKTTDMKITISIETTPEEINQAIKDSDFFALRSKIMMIASEQIEPAGIAKQLPKVTDLASQASAIAPGKEVKFKAAKGPENPKKKYERSWEKTKKAVTEKPISPIKGKPAATGTKHCVACGQDYKPTSNAQRYHNDECKSILTGQAVQRVVDNIISVPDPESQKISHFQRKKLEEKAAKEEQQLLESIKEHPKIDWKKAKRSQGMLSETTSI